MKIKYQELLELGCRCCEISELLAKLQLEEQNNYLDFFYISFFYPTVLNADILT